MPTIRSYEKLNLGLADFVDLANGLLPDYLPEQIQDQRVRGEVSPRLVRHYATQGLLEEPKKVGREARYSYRHLLQLLLIRRLLAEGHSSTSIDTLTTTHDDRELENLLSGGAEISVKPANSALAFLQGLSKKTPTPKPSIQAPSGQRWSRFEIAPGLELHQSDNFRYPSSPEAQEQLLQKLHQLMKKSRRSKS